ncbi:MAG: histidine phosphatase family protein [bacterium]
MGAIYLIRHGQASFGKPDYDSLSETGVRQCEILGKYLSETGVAFDRVYSGAMRRQTDSAKIALGDVAPVEMPEFDEHDTGAIMKSQLPGMVAEDPALSEHLDNFFTDGRAFQKLFSKAMYRWISGGHDAPGVETFKEFNKRVEKGFSKALDESGDDEKVAVFTSGGVISAIMRIVLGLSDEKAMRLAWWIRNTSVSVLRKGGSGLDMVSFNSIAHLERRNDPALLTYK